LVIPHSRLRSEVPPILAIDLSGKIALVTGASGQLGREIARTLARAGADVGVHYFRNAASAQQRYAEISAMGRRACILQADVTKEADVLRMRAEVTAALGAPDIIVNNAVANYTRETVLDQSVADYVAEFETCVLQNVLMTNAFVPAMIENKWGRVIGINTDCSMMYPVTQSAYVSGKRGMDGVLRILAKEVGMHNITVNQVAPGWTVSDDVHLGDPSIEVPYAARIPLGYRGGPENIANAVAFLASDLACFITGMYLPVCGGMVMPAI
jgi:3-oxoacyl-[acyl-carrier protein] reductase